MSRTILNEIMDFLTQPGGVSKSAWDDAYNVLCYVDVNPDVFLCNAISVISRVARARKVRLPDSLHNLMILSTSASSDPDDFSVGLRAKSNEKNIKLYLKMVAKISE